MVRSPFGGGIFEVSLQPEDVIAIVFWTKNADPLIPQLDELASRGFCFTFLYTVNNYPSLLEPRVPHCGHTIKVLRTLRERFPSSVVRWRYDTVVLTDELDSRWHANNFRYLCELMSPISEQCIFSFCDYYKKTVRNMDEHVPSYHIPSETECLDLSGAMAEIASNQGITLASCAHDFLVRGKIVKARCVDTDVLMAIVDSEARKTALKKLKVTPTRKECGCIASRDIGAYDTCSHGCVYCYANADGERARMNMAVLSPGDHSLDSRVKRMPEGS